MKRCVNEKSAKGKSFPLGKIVLTATISVVALMNTCYAQDAVQGIKNATEEVKRYYGVGIYLMYAFGAVAGIVGAVKTFNQWNSGDPHTTKTASAWFGSCLFLVVVATVLKTVFGI
jgi:hypothetical protein